MRPPTRPTTRRPILHAALALAGLLPSACESGASSGPTGTVYVDVVTGLVPGPEFETVRLQIFDANDPFTVGSERFRLIEGRARFGQDFESGRRFAELSLPVGTAAVRVDLLRRDGTVLVGRRVVVFVNEGTRVVRVHLTRDCVGVECPAPAGSPAFTECVGGQCADPRCEPPDPMYCPEIVFCNRVEDCPPVAPCSEPRCEEGLCQPVARVDPDPDACAEGQWCDPTSGCRPLDPEVGDAGMGSGPDASTGPVCGTVGCPVENECEVGYWLCDGGAPRCATVGNRARGAPCNGGAGTCDGLGTCTTP